MAGRTIKDAAGRSWTCAAAPAGATGTGMGLGGDLLLSCATPSETDPILITVGWQWEKMSENGLARIITLAAPAPRR